MWQNPISHIVHIAFLFIWAYGKYFVLLLISFLKIHAQTIFLLLL